jgi:predicted amidohydrolase
MIRLELPDTSTVGGVTEAVATIIQAAASGEITPGEAGDLCGLMEAQRRTIELSEIETRLAKLEAATGARK